MLSETEVFDPVGETPWLKLVTRETVCESLLLFDPFPTCHRRHFPWPVVEGDGRGSDHQGSGWQLSSEDKKHIRKCNERFLAQQVPPPLSPKEAHRRYNN